MLKETSNELDSVIDSIQPLVEISAYEALWNRDKSSFKIISEMFKSYPGKKPSDFVTDLELEYINDDLKKLIWSNEFSYRPKLLINNSIDYPNKLKDAQNPVEVLYYSGNLEYLHTKSIAIVGTRNPSEYGVRRAKKLTKLLVKDGYTIVSGLAKGIDTVAHKTAIESGGRTISVIGTPLNKVYPKENKNLQEYIAKKHLLISQVPFYRYSKQGINGNRLFFPQRNKTMSAISDATVIIEASDTSGTLIQARAALYQGRKLFILDSCFHNDKIKWPKRFLERGAIRVVDYNDIINNL